METLEEGVDISVSPDDKHIALGIVKELKVLDAKSCVERISKDQGSFVTSVAYSPNGRWLAVGIGDYLPIGGLLPLGGNAGEIRVWDTVTWKNTETLNEAAGPIVNLAFSPDGKLLASAGADDKIRIWDVSRLTSTSR
jgi:WD40 repeat protein